MSFFVVTINFLCGFTITLSLFITNLFNNTSVPILVLSSSPNINSYVEPEKVKSNFTTYRSSIPAPVWASYSFTKLVVIDFPLLINVTLLPLNLISSACNTDKTELPVSNFATSSPKGFISTTSSYPH